MSQLFSFSSLISQTSEMVRKHEKRSRGPRSWKLVLWMRLVIAIYKMFLELISGKSALVLFYHVNVCAQYVVLVIWLLHLTYICLV